jgi:hypothetical protein
MDDEDFKKYQIFTENEWKNIIHSAIQKSFKIIKMQVTNPNYASKKKLVPFETRD